MAPPTDGARPRPTRGSRFLRWLERGLVAGALICLGAFAAPLLEARWFDRAATRILERQTGQVEGPVAVQAAASGLIGRLEIPRLGMSAIVVEGQERETLRRAVGHVPGTALPGEGGNVALAAHRDTFFRPLRHVRPGDHVRLTTLDGPFDYRVEWIQVVDPEQVEVLDTAGQEVITLITCYPFDYVGRAPRRYVVRAQRHSF